MKVRKIDIDKCVVQCDVYHQSSDDFILAFITSRFHQLNLFDLSNLFVPAQNSFNLTDLVS